MAQVPCSHESGSIGRKTFICVKKNFEVLATGLVVLNSLLAMLTMPSGVAFRSRRYRTVKQLVTLLKNGSTIPRMGPWSGFGSLFMEKRLSKSFHHKQD